ncbi:adenylate cyclase regulatory domain-containing protein [Rothia sp. CCM 9417]|uniref:adenylate/guanylate cyclase domain-containing protein n=1 Tax=unclassified Rothia (in: high G+C Gram-positive bacteria) TaxID=2689056 RepID=UPI003ACC3CDA
MEKSAPGSERAEETGSASSRSRRPHNRVQSLLYRSDEARRGVLELERALLGDNLTMKRREVAEEAGVSLLTARKIWRSLGLPNHKDDDEHFTHADSKALKTVNSLVQEGQLSEEAALSITRSVGQMMDRMVVWQVEALVEDMVIHGGLTDTQARGELLNLLPRLIEDLEDITVYGYRRMLNSAILRLALRNEEDGAPLADSDLPLARGVGFVDLVSYTSLSREMNERKLASLVKNFEQRCAEVIAVGGGRIIKTVGDEVMYLVESPEDGARIALALSKLISEDPLLPEARVSFVWGRVLPRLGDIYGPTVNLASRLVALTEPGIVLTDASTAEALEDDKRFVLIPQGVRNVRGFGNVRPVAITPGIGNELEIDFE